MSRDKLLGAVTNAEIQYIDGVRALAAQYINDSQLVYAYELLASYKTILDIIMKHSEEVKDEGA